MRRGSRSPPSLPGEIKIEAPSTDKDADVLVHPGAKAYLDDGQQSFFDRYGDDIFYGMLIFPVFGSMIAGAASYFRNDTRTRRLRLLQALLDLTKKAHLAPIDRGARRSSRSRPTSWWSRSSIRPNARNSTNSARMSFTLAIEQARFAIAARRTVLLEHGGTAPASTSRGLPPERRDRLRGRGLIRGTAEPELGPAPPLYCHSAVALASSLCQKASASSAVIRRRRPNGRHDSTRARRSRAGGC